MSTFSNQSNVDLHCHSYVSDGVLAPAVVAQRAAGNGVQLWALTDHDELGGIAEARAAAKEVGLPFVAGVEISVTWAGDTVHIVGLGVDESNEQLRAGLAATRGGRDARAREMSDQLAAVGVPGAYEGARRYVDNPELISRTHFARYMVEQGVCTDVRDVFARYLSDGKPGFVPHRWAKLGDAVNWITQAGGVAVVAHPGRYGFDHVHQSAFLDEFIQAGGQGIEVVSGSHTVDQYREYATCARQYGLYASRGPDFHCPNESPADLGSLPPLPADLPAVWQLLKLE